MAARSARMTRGATIMTARSGYPRELEAPSKALHGVRDGLSGWKEEGSMPLQPAGARGRLALPRDDVAAGAGTCWLRPPLVSKVSRTPDRQPGPVHDMGVYHRGGDIRLSIVPIFQPAAHSLSAEVRSQVPCLVLFEAKSLGSLDETPGPLDTTFGRPAAEAPASQGRSLAGSRRRLFRPG
jgi:hypothetical protein